MVNDWISLFYNRNCNVWDGGWDARKTSRAPRINGTDRPEYFDAGILQHVHTCKYT